MRRIRIHRRKVRRDRPWPLVLALDPQEPNVVRAKTTDPSNQRSTS
jgi:hypothetical protein